MDYLGKGEVLTNTDLDRFVNNIWEKQAFCVHRKSLRSLSSAHEYGAKQKCCVYNFVQCIYIYIDRVQFVGGISPPLVYASLPLGCIIFYRTMMSHSEREYSPAVNVRKPWKMSILLSEVHELLLCDSHPNFTDLVLNACAPNRWSTIFLTKIYILLKYL